MSVDVLKGKACTRVYEHHSGNFTFEFGDVILVADTFWRVLAEGKIALTSRDHGQMFGLKEPVDAAAAAMKLLSQRRIVKVTLDEELADLFVEFEDGSFLEILNESSGYEPWNLSAPGVNLIALGGGGTSSFSG